jgi:hypothetical protein
MLRTLAFAALLLAAPSLAQSPRPPAPPEGARAVYGRAGWSVDAATGCWIWNASPQPNETVTWSGACDATGRATGRGVLEWRYEGKVSRYEGEMRDGQAHGHGAYAHAGGERYQGEFRHDLYHGQGALSFTDGRRYEGGFRFGRFDGDGVMAYPDGNRYQGQWRDGQFHGQGRYAWANGNAYEGAFRYGKIEGEGVMTYRNGDRYQGQWTAGLYHGRGRFSWADGDWYEGTFRYGRPDGQGRARVEGTDLNGRWLDGCYRGAGDRRVALMRSIEECR